MEDLPKQVEMESKVSINDDLLLLSDSEAGLQSILDRLSKYCAEYTRFRI